MPSRRLSTMSRAIHFLSSSTSGQDQSPIPVLTRWRGHALSERRQDAASAADRTGAARKDADNVVECVIRSRRS